MALRAVDFPLGAGTRRATYPAARPVLGDTRGPSRRGLRRDHLPSACSLALLGRQKIRAQRRLRYLRAFVEEMKASGFVAYGLKRSGQTYAAVAPQTPV